MQADEQILYPVFDTAFEQGVEAYKHGYPPPEESSFLFWCWELGWKFQQFLQQMQRRRA